MFERFRDKEPFNNWDPAVLQDYCDYALHPESEEEYRQLACDPINEASIYVSQAYSDAVLADLPRVRCPTVVMRARYDGPSLTDFSASPTWPGLAEHLPDAVDLYLPEMNHFIPMQDPALVAEHIRRAL